MKKYILLPFLLLTIFNINTHAQDKVEKQEELFSRTVMDAILNNKLDLLKEYQPTIELARKIVGERAKSMTDEQISQGMLIPLQERFQANVDKIQTEIKTDKIDLEKVEFKKYTIEKMDEGEFIPSAMSIQFSYKGEDESIPVSILKVNDKWYIFEILYATDIFKKP